MGRLLNILKNINSIISIFFIIYIVFLYKIYPKIKNKKNLLNILAFIPLIIGIIHFLVFNFHKAISTTFMYFNPLYTMALLIPVWVLTINKVGLKKNILLLLICCGVISYFEVTGNLIMNENLHNLSYENYTKSFTKTLKLMEKEYVLNDHKKIDYEYLYNKYYPNIKKSEEQKNEQLYLKTMFEFSKEFKDGHVFLGFPNTKEPPSEKLKFLNDYQNRDYGFITILLDNNKFMAFNVDKKSDAYKKGLRDGMYILKKNGISLDKILENVITPLNSYPVKRVEDQMKSLYLFATGNEEIEITYQNNQKEQTIKIKSMGNKNTRMNKLRDKIFLNHSNYKNLETKMLNENTGYLYIATEMNYPLRGSIAYVLDDSSYLTKKLDKKLKELRNKGMKNLILDLRSNSGGYSTESKAIAALFVDDKKLISKFKRYDGKIYDKQYLKGIGKYKDINVTILVNSETVSAGDEILYMLQNKPNIKIIGITPSKNSCQSPGGKIYLANGTSFLKYPTYGIFDKNDKVFIDTDNSGKETIKLSEKISLTKENIFAIYKDDDYLLNYCLKKRVNES